MALTRRTQILLDDERYGRLRQRAHERGTSIGEVVREAIDRSLDDEAERRFEAGQALLDAEPLEVEDWPVMEAEILDAAEGDLELPADAPRASKRRPG